MSTNEPTITVYDDTPIEEIIRQLDELGLLTKPVESTYEYRLYYDEDGKIYASASSPDAAQIYSLTGNYIVVDKETFKNQHKYFVRNGQLEEVTNNLLVNQLKKGNAGFEVVKNNASLLVEDGDNHTDTENYGYRNH